MNLSDSARIYTDMQGFGALRRGARENSPEALRAVAQQFEALFLNQILKGMRDGKLAEDVLGGEGQEMYQDLHDRQLALHLAQTHSIGIADMLVRQLGAMHQSSEEPAQNAPPTTTARQAAYTFTPREARLDLRI